MTIEQLRPRIVGRVIEPGDRDYDESRRLFYGGMDRKPAHIVRVAGASDVAHAIEFARDADVELAVRRGGHSVAGPSAREGGVVIDLRDLREMTIDTRDRTAWAQSGLTAQEYSVAAHEQGLATGFGDTGSVGLGGLTLGGGVGYLTRKHGLMVDNLIAAEVVTADGQIVLCVAESAMSAPLRQSQEEKCPSP